MELIPSIIAAIVLLGILITLHEIGHYLAGRLLQLPVIEFAIGMGPKLISFVRNGIRYSLRALPLGGFCAFNGEDSGEESQESERQGGGDEQKKDWLAIPLSERNLNDCPAWRRLVMQVSGVAMNFLTAYLCTLILLCVIGLPVSMNRISQVLPDSPAQEAGILAGDVILSVEGSESADISDIIAGKQGEPFSFIVERDGEQIELSVKARYYEDTDSYRMGIIRGMVFEALPVSEGIVRSGGVMIDISMEMYKALFGLIRGQGVEDTMGIIGTVGYMADQTNTYFTESLQSGFFMLAQLAILLSLNLGIINLLPLPALDGGRIVFTLIEMIFRRPVPRRIEAWIHAAGFVLLMGLMVLLLFKDIADIVSRIGGGA